ncbi:MAG TPA: tRNA threonylcarbamoyladenosine dehydratase [Clostridiaceae bacterium]|nr:tRNA threonylcarbamoyladenosine dehydratase [Clostridiaceae bacterium]
MKEIKENPLFTRSLPLLTEQGAFNLQNAKVALFGLGGVGSYTAEALARSGIGHFELIDHDFVEPSNLNRQLCALQQTIGLPKVTVVKQRILDINPQAKINIHQVFYNAESGLDFLPRDLNYIVDAIDSVQSKIDLIIQAHQNQIPIISAMGAGNKYDPTGFRVCDIFQTYNDRLAKKLRSELKKNNITRHAVVFSPEKSALNSRKSVASLAYVPAVCGLICAAKVVEDIAQFSFDHNSSNNNNSNKTNSLNVDHKITK